MGFSFESKRFASVIAVLLFMIPNLIVVQQFELVVDTPFYDLSAGASAFADIDNDGDDDLIMMGNRRQTNLPQNENYIAKLYKNDGEGNFTEVLNTPFRGLQEGKIAFADVDGDNDLDLMIIGIDYFFDPYTRLYINDGIGNFNATLNSPFVDVYSGDIVFADVDGDEDLDVFVSGSTVAFQIDSSTRLYFNDGNGNYMIQANAPFVNAKETSMDVSDIDMDGDLDMILLGTSEAPVPVTVVYLNDGSGNYTVGSEYNFEQLSSGSVSFSDIDNDGDEDLLLTGTTDGGLTPFTQLYDNDGVGNFTENLNSSLVDLKFVASIFCDFDNDGFEDLLMSGKSSNSPDVFAAEGKETILYKNDGTGIFEAVEDVVFPPLDLGYLAWSDVNGDSFNDVFIMGTLDQGVTFHSKLYLNSTIVSSFDENTNVSDYEVNIYPNPVDGGTLYVKFKKETELNSNIVLVDVLGRNMKVETSLEDNGILSLDISRLDSGTYFLSIGNGVYSTFQKI